MTDGDLRLWHDWRARADGDAFGALVRPHVEFAHRLAVRSGLASTDADDAVQRALIRLAAEPGDKPLRVGLRAWLGRSVRSEALMFFRASRRRAAHEATARIEVARDSAPIEVRDEVERALAELDERARTTVELRFLHDLEYREIAFIEGGTALGARLRVHRALGRLRARFGRGAALSIAALAVSRPTSSNADAMVARSIEATNATASAATRAIGVSALAGGLAMSTKAGIAVSAVACVAGAWIALRREPPTAEAPRAETARADAPPPSAPPMLAVPARTSAPPAPKAPVAGEPAVAPSAPAATSLDAPIPAGKGSVLGVLTLEDGKPFAHARVALWGTPQVPAETDAEGRFHIHGDWVGERDLTLLGDGGSSMSLAPVVMAADARVDVAITVVRGVTLSGIVREAVKRAPVAGAKVTVRRPGAHSKNGMQAGFCFATTDAEGRFRFEHVPSAGYHLVVACAGHQAYGSDFVVESNDRELDVPLAVAQVLRVRLTNVPPAAIGTIVQWMIQSDGNAPSASNMSLHGKTALAAPGELALDAPPPGEYRLTLFEGKLLPRLEAVVDVVEGAAPDVSISVPAGACVDGTLLAQDGRPLIDTPVRVGESPVVRTDATGRFRVEQSASGKQPIWLGGGVGSLSLRVGEVDVAASGSTTVVVTAPGSASISLRLTRPSTMGLVTLSLADGVKIADAWPDDRGRVDLRHLRGGDYVLKVFADDAVALERTIRLFEDQALALGDLALEMCPVVPVRVTFPPGVARPTQVTVFSGEPGRAFGRAIGRIEFDGQGRGWLKGLPAGEHHVTFQWTAMADSADLPTADLVVRDGITTPIEIVLRGK